MHSKFCPAEGIRAPMDEAVEDHQSAPVPQGVEQQGDGKLKPVALQLYSLREQVYPGGADLPGVLKTVAEIGYKGVEFAGLHDDDPKEIAKLLRDLGLQACSSHTALPTAENVREIADTQLTLGSKHAISGFGPDDVKTVDGCKQVAAKFAKAAELLKPYGMTYGFHNHWWEFDTVEGRYAYDILMEEAGEAFSELDVYWCAFGKADPVKVVGKYKSRLPLLHIKDGMLIEGQHVHTAVGSGKLDMPAIIGAADPNVLEWLIVELDNCETDMLEAVRQSCKYLTSTGLGSGTK
jgi:sugar phosphate isomerase/epimerase